MYLQFYNYKADYTTLPFYWGGGGGVGGWPLQLGLYMALLIIFYLE